MSKRIFSSFIVLIILNIMVFQSLMTFSAAQAEDAVIATSPEDLTEPETSAETTAEESLAFGETVQHTTEQPTTYVKPLKFPSLSVSAISNFFGKANADYNQYTKEVTVTYFLKASSGILTTQWNLSYDPKVLKLNPKKNSPKQICPIIKDSGVVDFEEGKVRYNATSVGLFDFSADDAPYVKLVFDVNDIPEDEPQITKIDLTIDTLWLMDGDSECFVVNNFKVADLTKLRVRISKGTTLTDSNYVEPTTAEPTTAAATKSKGTLDEQKSVNPSQPSTSPTNVTSPDKAAQVTNPGSNNPKNGGKDNNNQAKPKPENKKQNTVKVVTGNPVNAIVILILLTAGMVALLIARKKLMLNLMLKD